MVEIMPGCEPWSHEGGDIGVLVLHGFTGSPASMRGVAESLAADGFSVELPRLPGHGTRWQDLAKTTWRDWTRESVAAFERLRARTRAQVAVGLSMGGVMALHLAATRGEDLAGVVSINAQMLSHHPLRFFTPVLKRVVPSIPGVVNDIAKPGADERGYERIPVRAAASYTEFHVQVHRQLGDVTIPALIFQSRQDHVVPPDNGPRILADVSSTDKELIWLERSYHVATLDYDVAEIEKRTAEFVRRVAGGQ
jgi:carboxylesterase